MPNDHTNVYFDEAVEEFIKLIRMQQNGELPQCSSHLQMDGHLAVFTIKTPRPIAELLGG